MASDPLLTKRSLLAKLLLKITFHKGCLNPDKITKVDLFATFVGKGTVESPVACIQLPLAVSLFASAAVLPGICRIVRRFIVSIVITAGTARPPYIASIAVSPHRHRCGTCRIVRVAASVGITPLFRLRRRYRWSSVSTPLHRPHRRTFIADRQHCQASPHR